MRLANSMSRISPETRETSVIPPVTAVDSSSRRVVTVFRIRENRAMIRHQSRTCLITAATAQSGSHQRTDLALSQTDNLARQARIGSPPSPLGRRGRAGFRFAGDGTRAHAFL